MKQREAQNMVNSLADRFANSGLNGLEILKTLTNDELTAYISIATLNYGRKWDDAIENALYHMQNRPRAEKLFGTKSDET